MTFRYFAGIQEDFANMVGEIGSAVTLKIPTHKIDAFGNLVSDSWQTITETIWPRQLNEVMEIQGIGQLNKEDLRFVAKYDSSIVPETEITFNEIEYIVLMIDKPNVSSPYVNRVGYAKKKLT